MPRSIDTFITGDTVHRMVMTVCIGINLTTWMLTLEMNAGIGRARPQVKTALPSDLSGVAVGDTVWCLNTGTYLYAVTFDRRGTLRTPQQEIADEVEAQLAPLRAEVASLRARVTERDAAPSEGEGAALDTRGSG